MQIIAKFRPAAATYWLAALALLLISQAGGAQAQTLPAVTIAPDGAPPETVFNWKTSRCNDDQIPDSPARAFKTADGQVFLYATHYTNQPMTGDTLDNVKPGCRLGMPPKMNADPEMYDAKIWLQTFYTTDGNTIYSLGSSDYHGAWFDKCSVSKIENTKCWWSAIVLGISTDRGRTFTTASPPSHIIARSPHSYKTDQGSLAGFFTTSNIVKRDNFYYSLIFTQGFKEQKRGNCLMRTGALSNPNSWRTWNGEGFATEFAPASVENVASPERYACLPVKNLPEPVRSLVWHAPSKSYIAIFSSVRKLAANEGRGVRVQFNYSTSSNLTEWAESKPLASFDSPPQCEKAIPPVSYPSLLDPQSTDINFGTVGAQGYIYFTQYNAVKECRLNLNRDLMRMKVKIEPR